MTEKTITELINETAQKTGKQEEEIRGLVESKVAKFSGLLTEQGAIFMVQKELGIREEITIQTKINELQEGMKGIELKGEILAVYPIKEFEKNGKKGKLKSFLIGDGTGEVRATLWNDQVDKYDLTRGSEIEILGAVITEYNQKKQVTLGFNGNINVLNKKEESFEKISNLMAGLNSVNVAGRIIRKFPCKEFENAEKKGRLCSFQLGDETAIIRATAWNEKADEIERFGEGDTIQIMNGYTKEGRFGAELNLGYNAIISETKKEIAGLGEILKESTKEKRINALVDGENVIIKGKIKEITQGKLAYLVCEKCGKKVNAAENGVLCEKCGEVKGKQSAVVSAIIEDDAGRIKATMFREKANEFLGLGEKELEKELAEKSPDKIIEEINEKVLGREIKLMGYQKINSFSGENEFMVKEIL